MIQEMSPIYAQLHRWASQTHVWGFDDCMTRIADWCMENGHADPMGELRWTYDGPVSCQRATGFMLDPVGVCSRQFESIGLQRGNELRAGDVGVVRRLDDPRFPIGAMWTGHAWAMSGETGVVDMDKSMIEVLAFWSVGYET